MSTLAESLEPPVPQEEIDAAAAEQPKTEDEPKGEEPKAEEKKAEEDPRPEKLVRIQALDEERHKRKKAQAELQAEQQRRAILEDRWNQLLAAQQQPQPQIPDATVDPLANHDARLQQAEKTAQELMQEKRAREAQAQQYQQFQAFAGQVASLESEYEQENPDYKNALNFLKDRRSKELRAVGYNAAQVNQIVINDAAGIAMAAIQSGRNPGEVIYQMAVDTGYVKGKREVPAEQKMQTLQKGAEAAKGLGAGGVASGNPTPEQIAAMSEEEFDAFKKKLAKSGKRMSDAL